MKINSTPATKNKTLSECKYPIQLTAALQKVQSSLDIMVTKAEKLFYNCEYKKCMNILDE